jgi:hypothetical protein
LSDDGLREFGVASYLFAFVSYHYVALSIRPVVHVRFHPCSFNSSWPEMFYLLVSAHLLARQRTKLLLFYLKSTDLDPNFRNIWCFDVFGFEHCGLMCGPFSDVSSPVDLKNGWQGYSLLFALGIAYGRERLLRVCLHLGYSVRWYPFDRKDSRYSYSADSTW